LKYPVNIAQMIMLTSLRSISRRRTEVAVILLGIGLASAFTWAAASFLIRQLLEPLPVERIDRLVHLNGLANVEAHDPVQWWSRMNSLESLANYRSGALSLEGRDEPLRIQTAVVSSGFFHTLGAPLAAGRMFTGTEDREVAAVAVLSSSLAARLFQDPREAVGKTVRLSGIPFTVIGVASAGFSFPAGARVWLPRPVAGTLNVERVSGNSVLGQAPTAGWIGRIREGHSADAVRSESMVLLSYLNTQVSRKTGVRYGDIITVVPLREFLLGRNRPLLWLILLAATSVLLIASLNASLLFLGIAARRQAEFSTRSALGATTGMLFRQVLGESVLVAAISGVVGVSFGALVTRILPAWIPMSGAIYDLSHSFIKGAFVVVLLLAPAAGMLAGFIPSLRASTSATASLASRGHYPGLGCGARWLSGSLLAVQVCFTFCLVTTADTSIRSALAFAKRHTGFDAGQVLTASLDLNRGLETVDPDPDDKAHSSSTHAALLERQQLLVRDLSELPGVVSAAFAGNLPGISSHAGMLYANVGDSGTVAYAFHVSPGYFKTLRIPLTRGRDFTFEDRATIILSQSLAARFFGVQDPVGKSVRLDGEESERLVIAVAAEVQVRPNDSPSPPQMYLPSAAAYRSRTIPAGYLAVRCPAGCSDVRKNIRQASQSIAGASSSYDWTDYSVLMARNGSPLVLRGAYFTAAALLTMLILVCGVFAVVYHQASGRASEAGIHAVVGATPTDVVRLLLRDVLVAASAGVAAGLILSLAAGQLLRSLVLSVNPYDPAGYIRAAFVLLAAVGLSGLVPALQMARQNPRKSLGSL
jgi:predicted permease